MQHRREVQRHAFTTPLIRDGKDPALVAALSGHGLLDTTSCYAPAAILRSPRAHSISPCDEVNMRQALVPTPLA
ncbi:hypothetical protein [Nonomuraea dietziae]|uniref:hypothetical protein n=1 Tax=Nonomuraea dietziae TaxID=65515 RepID=UPI003403AD16